MSDFHSHAIHTLLWSLLTLMSVWVIRESETHTEENQKAVYNFCILFTETGLDKIGGLQSHCQMLLLKSFLLARKLLYKA